MRKTLLSLVLGCVLAAFSGAAIACEYYHNTNATNDSSSTQQTATAVPASADANN